MVPFKVKWSRSALQGVGLRLFIKLSVLLCALSHNETHTPLFAYVNDTLIYNGSLYSEAESVCRKPCSALCLLHCPIVTPPNITNEPDCRLELAVGSLFGLRNPKIWSWLRQFSEILCPNVQMKLNVIQDNFSPLQLATLLSICMQ